MGVLVLTGAMAGGVLMNRTDEVSRELIDDIQPARVAAYRLQAALRDQETAARGYAIAADRQFLEPYYEGQRPSEPRPTGSAVVWASPTTRTPGRPGRRRTSGDELATRLRRAAHRQRYTGDAERHRPRDHRPGQGRVRPDPRELFDMQKRAPVGGPRPGRGQPRRVRGWRDRVLVAMVVAFFVTAILLAAIVRKRRHPSVGRTWPRSVDASPRANSTPRSPARTEGHPGHRDRRREHAPAHRRRTRRRAVGPSGARRAGRGAAPVERRTRAVRVRRLPRSAGTLAQGRRRSANCSRSATATKLDERAHEYIGFAVDGAKRMQVAHQRPADVLPGGPAQRHRHRRRPGRRLGRRPGQPRRVPSRNPVPRSCGTAAAAPGRSETPRC